MILQITPSSTGGKLTVPPSKSLSHRAIIAASLADGTSEITNVLLSRDIEATIAAVQNFGASIDIRRAGNNLVTLKIKGNSNPQVWDRTIDCEESGSTLRFLIPILAIDSKNTTIIGEEGLAKRPLNVYFDIFEKQNFKFEKLLSNLPLVLDDSLKAGDFELPGDISSQFISGLLFALPLLKKDSTITLTSRLESKPYVDLTLDILDKFGVKIEKLSDRKFFIPGNQSYKSCNYHVPGDFSQASFWFVNGAINNETTLLDLDQDSIQGDSEIIEILKGCGVKTNYDSDWEIYPCHYKPFKVDVSDTPDLAPILAVLASLADGVSTISGIKRLRIKESDRVESIKKLLESFGVEIEIGDNELKIVGQKQLKATTVNTFNDHRIAIAAAIASGRADGDVTILEAECVNKSYPTFWQDFRNLGGKFNELHLG